jgi:hypothetical protein
MLQFGPLAFAQPWLLLALASLPALWWLLKVTPPAPKRQRFPAVSLLLGLRPKEETPARTPLWLILLRLLMAALIVLGLSQPVLNPGQSLYGSGPLLLVIDDGWAAARDWQARLRTAEELLKGAEREERDVVLLRTAPSVSGEAPAPSRRSEASEIRRQLEGLQPNPWPTDRQAALESLESVSFSGAVHVVWLSDGLDGPGVGPLAKKLQSLGRLDVLRDAPGESARLLLAPEATTHGLDVMLRRAETGQADLAVVVARGDDGRILERLPVRFGEDDAKARASMALPAEMTNRIASLEIENESTAGATVLIDERWRRRPVGLLSEGLVETPQPFLDELYYLDRALSPYAELRRGDLQRLLERELAVLAVPDAAGLPESAFEKLGAWVKRGGLLLRFAGPRLAREGGDPLLPVTLRQGGRTLAGAMTWGEPARLAPFHQDSPFAGLETQADVTVERQVLAEPSLELAENTWARLSDGTPLVTAERRGDGWVVLFHTTSNREWSNLPLSGLFVEMLRRVVQLSQGVRGDAAAAGPLPPVTTMDAFGRLSEPGPSVFPLDAASLAAGADADVEPPTVTPRTPPGIYGGDSFRAALNLAPTIDSHVTVESWPQGVKSSIYSRSTENAVGPWLLAAALLLASIDILVGLALRGMLPMPGRRRATAAAIALALGAGLVMPRGDAMAQSDDRFALQATLETRLAYVLTGVPAVDEVSKQGLTGLTDVLIRRSAVEPGRPLGVDINSDELAFFPLLYWPISPEQRQPSSFAVDQLNRYMANGGTILFDLREEQVGSSALTGVSRAQQALRRITAALEMPPLTPVPPEHVLTKAFYLMQDFPGRYAGGTLWVESDESASGDGVASVIVGANDWAAAWAVTPTGRPLYAVTPGGERQRELAYRFGINLVMYALTGNYKADQVHIPAILERLGQ